MKTYRVVHTTKYNFNNTISCCRGEIRLRAQTFSTQQVNFSQLIYRPIASIENQEYDRFGNIVNYFEITNPFKNFCVSAINTVDVSPKKLYSFADSTPWHLAANQHSILGSNQPVELTPYLAASPLIEICPQFSNYTQIAFNPNQPLLLGVEDLTRRLHSEFIYDSSATHVGTTAWRVMQTRRGVCQDFAHVAIACLRSIGIAARYVSGYRVRASSLPAQQRTINSELLHAWFSVYDPQFGWVDFDPTNNCTIDDNYITIGWGRDYYDVTPLSGNVAEANQHKMHVSIDIEKL